MFGINKVEDFKTYYKTMGLKLAQTDEELNDCLVQAVKNSRRKGYHGVENDALMPELYDQAELRALRYLEQVAHVKVEKEEFFDVVSESSNNETLKQRVKLHIKSITLKDEFKNDDSKWQEVAVKNFDFVKQILTHKHYKFDGLNDDS